MDVKFWPPEPIGITTLKMPHSNAFQPDHAHAYPESVIRLMGEFAALPGIGRRTAERLAFHILKSERSQAERLAKAVVDVKENVRHCPICFNFTEAQPCAICRDERRDHAQVLVVEEPKDVIALEQTGMYRGNYHVLLGRIAPLENIQPEDLTIDILLKRIDNPAENALGVVITEIILGLSPNLEGDGTAMYLAKELQTRELRITRLARGLPSGTQIEYANKAVLADAILGRQTLD